MKQLNPSLKCTFFLTVLLSFFSFTEASVTFLWRSAVHQKICIPESLVEQCE